MATALHKAIVQLFNLTFECVGMTFYTMAQQFVTQRPYN